MEKRMFEINLRELNNKELGYLIEMIDLESGEVLEVSREFDNINDSLYMLNELVSEWINKYKINNMVDSLIVKCNIRF